MYDLTTFYRSKTWRLFVADIRHRRLNDEGLNTCEYCGKPIVKAYDCIAHHKEELTEDNVNNAEISLNADNIMLVHHKCHNIIHNKLGYKYRGVWLVYGSPLSGKTSYVNEVADEGDLIIDIDSIWECVSGCDRYVKPKRLNSVVFGVRDCLLDSVRYRRGKWNNAYIIGGYPLTSERERLCKELGAKEVLIESTEQECIDRLIMLDDSDKRKQQTREWIKYIEDWHRLYIPPL